MCMVCMFSTVLSRKYKTTPLINAAQLVLSRMNNTEERHNINDTKHNVWNENANTCARWPSFTQMCVTSTPSTGIPKSKYRVGASGTSADLRFVKFISNLGDASKVLFLSHSCFIHVLNAHRRIPYFLDNTGKPFDCLQYWVVRRRPVAVV